MVEEATYSISTQQKEVDDSYDFLVKSGQRNSSQQFLHPLIGLPSVPQLGKYGRNGYELNPMPLLVAVECFCDETKREVRSAAFAGTVINLPQEVKELLFNVPEIIKHNKPDTQEEGQTQKKNPQNQKKNYIQDFHPFHFKNAVNINVLWSVSVQNAQIEHHQPRKFINLVCHPLVFGEIVFEHVRRLVHNLPVAVIVPADIANTCGVAPWTLDTKGVSFGSLRSEYLSCHLRQGSLCFSPNNLKIEQVYDATKAPLIHFYSLALQEDGFHYLTYHWNILDASKLQQVQRIAKQSKNIAEFIDRFQHEMLGGAQNEAVTHVRQLWGL